MTDDKTRQVLDKMLEGAGYIATEKQQPKNYHLTNEKRQKR